MAEGGSNSSNTCSICTEKFKNPKILPCFHSFCLNCLHQFVSSSSKNGQFFCPMCRYQVTLPQNGVTGFQTNFYIAAREKKELHGAGECCGMCEQCASHTCHECELLLCDSCTKYHKVLPATRSHLLINLSDSGTSLLSQQQFCEKHTEEKLRFYCKACSKVICRDCKLTGHEGHKTEDISDITEEARVSLTKTKVKLEKNKTKIEEACNNITRKNTDMLKNMRIAEREINKFADTFLDSLREVIDRLRSKQLTEVKDEEQIQNKKYSDEKHALTRSMRFLQSQINHTETILREGLDCDLITADGEMKQRLTEIEKEQETVSNMASRPVYIPPKPVANPGQLEVVICGVSDVMSNAFIRLENIQLTKEFKKRNSEQNSFFAMFFKTPTVLTTQQLFGDQMFRIPHFHLYKKLSSKRTWKLEVTMDDWENRHSNQNPQRAIPPQYKKTKKLLPSMNTNDAGDKCSIADDYNVVIIKPVNGAVRMLTCNPFAEAGREFKPVDVCWGHGQQVYIFDSGTNMIIVYSLQHAFQKSIKLTSTDSFTAIVLDNAGELWIGDEDGNTFNIK